MKHEASCLRNRKMDEQKLLCLIRLRKYDEVDKLLRRIKPTEFTSELNVFTALQLAIILGRLSLVKTLLDLGANPETRGYKGRQLTPLQLAAKYGHADVVHLLVAKGGCANGWHYDKSDPPIHIAAYHGQLDAFKALLSLNADVTSKNVHKGTLLHTVCAGSWTRLPDNYYSIKIFDNSYTTLGMSTEHEAVLLNLVELGLDVNARDSTGNTPLYIAMERGNTKVIKALITNGASTILTNEDNNTFLHKSCH